MLLEVSLSERQEEDIALILAMSIISSKGFDRKERSGEEMQFNYLVTFNFFLFLIDTICCFSVYPERTKPYMFQF